jgi:hypothetical protein
MVQNQPKSKVSPKPLRATEHPAPKELFEPIKPVGGGDEEISLRVKIEGLLTGTLGKVIDRISLLLSFVSFVIHLTDTYVGGILTKFFWVDVSIMIFYVFEYLLYLYAAQHKMLSILTVTSIVNISTFMPLTFIFYTNNPTTDAIYKITIVVRFERIVRYLIKLFSTGKNEVSRQMYTILLTVFSLVLVTTGIIQVLESVIRPGVIQQQM